MDEASPPATDQPAPPLDRGQAPSCPEAASPHLPLRLMLSFSPASFERRFVEHYVGFYHRYAQASLALGLLLLLGDFLVDLWAHPRVSANFLRLEIAVPVLAAGLGYTYLPSARKHWQPVIAGFIVAVAYVMFWVLLRIDAEGGAGLKSWVGILNFTILELYCFVILGVQFRFAFISGLAIWLAFEAALWWQPGLPPSTLAYWSYHVITLLILATGVGWWREYLLRKEFLTHTALEQSRAAAEHLARTKSDFLATMSHEIRTPMNGVLGMNELLIDSNLTPQQRTWAKAVQASGQHLLAVLNDVLDVSKIESGYLTLEEVDFDPGKVVADAMSMFAQPAIAKGLTLVAQLAPPDSIPGLRGDPLRLRQILANLISNAVKFTAQGEVVVSLEVLSREALGTTLRFCVQDTGIGILPQARGQIFEQFSQADSSTTRRYGGTGLGLAICRQLVVLMGGRIDVESVPGQGSRFVVELRLPLARQIGATDVATPSSDGAPLSAGLAPLQGMILLVEDNPVNQSVAAAMLNRLCLQWQLAENGAIAVQRVQEQRYDLVLMDCQMPVMDGYEATAAIRRLPMGRGASLPIVALTANAAQGESERCLAAGMSAFMAKPISLASLRATLAHWLPTQPSMLPRDEDPPFRLP